MEQILSESSISQNASMYGYNEDEDEKWLLDEAELSYNRIVDTITNSCINEVPNDTESLSPVVQAPDLQATEILDTGDLSQVNFVYNDITFQVYPDPKISYERSGGAGVRPGEDESATRNFLQVGDVERTSGTIQEVV
jgi:hypothetical protein